VTEDIATDARIQGGGRPATIAVRKSRRSRLQYRHETVMALTLPASSLASGRRPIAEAKASPAPPHREPSRALRSKRRQSGQPERLTAR
jgi:hypothetical protein